MIRLVGARKLLDEKPNEEFRMNIAKGLGLACLLALASAPAHAAILWTLDPVVVAPDSSSPNAAETDPITVSGSFTAIPGSGTITDVDLTIAGDTFAGSYVKGVLAQPDILGAFQFGTDTSGGFDTTVGEPVIAITGLESLFSTVGLAANLFDIKVFVCDSTFCDIRTSEPYFLSTDFTPEALTGVSVGEVPLPAPALLLLTGLGALALQRRG